MKTKLNVRSLTRSLVGLFVTKKTVNALKLYPNEYNKHYYFNKPLSDGIELVAAIERTTKKQAAQKVTFKFLPKGNKATNYRPAWWIQDKE